MQKYNLKTGIISNQGIKGRIPSFNQPMFSSDPIGEIKEIHKSITNEQIEVLEDAIRQYKRLEEIKKYTKMVLSEIEAADEKQLERETEEIKSRLKEDVDFDIDKLLNSENFLEDLYADGFDN